MSKRRSGNAVVNYLETLGYVPDAVVMVGLGMHHEEVLVMREAWPDMYLYGFEPHPDVYSTYRYSFPGILLNRAVSDREGEAVLHSSPNWKDGSSLFEKTTQESKIQQIGVLSTTLDIYLVPYEKRWLLWLDCEGSELNALKGAENFLKKVDVINVEMTGVPRGNGWCKPEEVHTHLLERGFRPAWIHTIRPSICQYDCIYLSDRVFVPERSCFAEHR